MIFDARAASATHALGAVLMLSVCTTATRAQIAPLSASVASRYVVAESLSALARLDSATRAATADASTWHRLGSLAWSVRNYLRNSGDKNSERTVTLTALADSALRRAATLDPSNAEYQLDVGRMMLESGISLTRAASYSYFERALELARRGTNKQLHARTAIEAGRVHWRRFDSFGNRWMQVGHACINLINRVANGGPRSVELRPAKDVRAIRDLLGSCAQPISDLGEQSGEADYIQAESLFREAVRADSLSARAFTELAALLCERDRWVELAALARQHFAYEPREALAWLALGLAEQRQGRVASATVAFDSALALLPIDERRRLDRVERVLRPTSAASVAQLDSTGRDWFRNLYWKSAVPLWTDENVVPRTEFLARVAEAELRWSVDELNVRGADTDRGEVFIRYGQPGLTFSIRPPGSSELYTVWGYEFGFVFKFVGQVTFATAQIPPESQQAVGSFMARLPVRWSGLENFKLDSLPIQVARFRGAADSLEILVAVASRASDIQRTSELRTDVRTDAWLSLGGSGITAHDSVMKTDDRVQTFVRTVPFGTYLVRAEASAGSAQHAFRATAVLLGTGADQTIVAPRRGFSMSDVLLAEPSTDPVQSPARWRDLDVRPLVGNAKRRAQVALIWESYGLAAREGTTRYSVAVTLRRQRSGAGRVAAAIVGGVGRAVGVTSSNNQISMRYERAVAATDVALDNIVLALQDTPPGAYTLTVSITDAVTGAVVSRVAQLTIADK
ncbi:MAG TPA: GWxTD domain-containing protein [Gemmatimonadaceae bacterium]|nr:GWxTD domain-containing protein [Gemmatimonadaceae bacterium]